MFSASEFESYATLCFVSISDAGEITDKQPVKLGDGKMKNVKNEH